MKEVVPDLLVSLFVKVWNEHNDTWRHVERATINYGWCYQFAMLLRKLHGSHVELHCDCGHAWVKIGDKFYDSDTPNGTHTFRGLSGPPHGSLLKENMSEEDFTHLWRFSGSGGIQFNVIEQVIDLYRGAVG